MEMISLAFMNLQAYKFYIHFMICPDIIATIQRAIFFNSPFSLIANLLISLSINSALTGKKGKKKKCLRFLFVCLFTFFPVG